MGGAVAWLRAVVVDAGDPRGTRRVTDSVDLTAPQGHARRRIALRLLLLAVTAIALYLVLPGLIAMFGSLPQLEAVFPAWFVPIFVLEAAAFACIWALMRIALHTDNWFDIACAQLTGNALSHALPGGAATGGATMFQMLTAPGSTARPPARRSPRSACSRPPPCSCCRSSPFPRSCSGWR